MTAARTAAAKVPQVAALFWVTKVLTTGMGETTSDFLAHRLDPMIAVALAGVVLLASLALQLAVRRYIAAVYWFAVVMVSVFGTMAADVLHVGLGIPYAVSTAFFLVVLAAIFALWYAVEKTLSIHSIRTRRRELFYWATVLTTFALGTAAGDWTASTLGWGYLASGIVFAAVITVPALVHGYTGKAPILSFWLAYIVTRPLGASFADWMGVPAVRSGLGWGTGPVSLVLALLIAGLVAYLSVSRDDVEPDPLGPAPVADPRPAVDNEAADKELARRL